MAMKFTDFRSVKMLLDEIEEWKKRLNNPKPDLSIGGRYFDDLTNEIEKGMLKAVQIHICERHLKELREKLLALGVDVQID